MIIEVATITIREGEETAFVAAVQQAVDIFRRAPGCLGVGLTRCVENPRHFDLVVRWKTLEDHTVGFRGSALFPQWRALVGHFFDGTPNVRHYADLFEPVTF